ncbi:hypothetical protein [Pseudomonas sp. PH1b]|uniref:hypothetical protein n=1 Tax=Pseudomonas sp. PH1b TaxID=1397282 RepID=UPI0012FEB4E0|nr:hypothetical protein [Pseudomonas sp. PH1b]
MRTYAAAPQHFVNMAEVRPDHCSVSAVAEIVTDACRLDAPRSIRRAGSDRWFLCKSLLSSARPQGTLQRAPASGRQQNAGSHPLTNGHASP